MRVVMLTQSLISDWNHGNAHFLRGVATALLRRGHEVVAAEPRTNWSLSNLIADQGDAALSGFTDAYPSLTISRYDDADSPELASALDGADLILVHEWTAPDVITRAGRHRASHPECRLLFHDTHHRAVSAPEDIAALDLKHYDGVLAFGRVIRDRYLSEGWARHAWTWHEAADVDVFYPRPPVDSDGDLVWIGNWGDDERGEALMEFLIGPVSRLRLRASVYGVRYPAHALEALEEAGITYRGWLPNYKVPEVFSRFSVTVHVPRRAYRESLPGIPTIRPFEALACGIPLVCAPWSDSEQLFTPGRDFLVVQDGDEMVHHLRTLLDHPLAAAEMAAHGIETILARHTCDHRVDELLAIDRELRESARTEVHS